MVNAIIHVLINTKAKIQAHDPENVYIQLFLNKKHKKLIKPALNMQL